MKKVNNELEEKYDKQHFQNEVLLGKIKEVSEINKKLIHEASLKEKYNSEKIFEDR